MPTLFRRKTTTDLAETAVEETSAPAETRRGYTPSKKDQGVVTPKRAVNGRRIITNPAERKAAQTNDRAARRQQRLDEREAMMRGEEHALLPRDRGPEKRLVRDVVDARRNASSYFLFGLVLLLLLSMIQTPTMILITYGFMLFMLLTIVLDGFALTRRVKSVVKTKMPKAQPRWGSLYFYGIMRATQFRRMRVPRPQVKIGDSI